MRVAHVCPTQGQRCGIALFAATLLEQMREAGIAGPLLAAGETAGDVDLAIFHHHGELVDPDRLPELLEPWGCPVVLFPHDPIDRDLAARAAGTISMCRGMVPPGGPPTLTLTHPALAPARLSPRRELRERFGLPVEPYLLGTCSFLKFERQLVEVVTGLLPAADRNDFHLSLTLSPWHTDSPGLMESLVELARENPEHLFLEYRYLDERELNLRLQACDLLWCWTRAPSTPYASGVASQQYATGSRMFVADKLQHEHVLDLPNVIRAPADLEEFVAGLAAAGSERCSDRHDPSPVSWSGVMDSLVGYLEEICSGHIR